MIEKFTNCRVVSRLILCNISAHGKSASYELTAYVDLFHGKESIPISIKLKITLTQDVGDDNGMLIDLCQLSGENYSGITQIKSSEKELDHTDEILLLCLKDSIKKFIESCKTESVHKLFKLFHREQVHEKAENLNLNLNS